MMMPHLHALAPQMFEARCDRPPSLSHSVSFLFRLSRLYSVLFVVMQSYQSLARPGRPTASRSFHQATTCQSGHSRWSKIKHDKAKVDSSKNKARSVFAQEIATASKLFGGDPNFNPRLADLIVKANRSGFAKASIEAAVARGQGRSVNGAALETVTLEAMLPNNVGVVIDCETDSRLRTLADLRVIIKQHGGNATPTGYLFTKKGRIIFANKDGVGVDDVFEPALEAGALDVDEDGEGRVLVYTEPTDTKSTGETLSTALGLDIASSEIISDANEDTKVALSNAEATQELVKFADAIQDKENGVQGIYMNVTQGTLEEGAWAELQSRITA
jgi:YebC/PmpR family DNA-binding regulatory protein